MHKGLEVVMQAVADVFAATTTPSPQQTVDPALVTPGPAGFVAIALLSLIVVALIWDMMRRIRRGRVRADINEQLDAEERAAAGEGAAPRADPEVPPGETPPRA